MEAEFTENCTHPKANYTFLDHRYSVPLTFISSFLSVIGSVLIIASFLLWRDVRQSTARVILLFLAFADLGTGVSYFAAAIGYVSFMDGTDSISTSTITNSTTYHSFCKVQSFFTTFFPVSSFFWTVVLGLYFLFALTFRRPRWGPKFIAILNFFGWIVPSVFFITMSALGVLGPTTKSVAIAGDWCFVSDSARYNLIKGHWNYWVFEGVCGKFWELLSFAIVIVCYGIIFLAYRCKKQNATQTAGTTSIVVTSSKDQGYDTVNRAMQNIDFKLLLIPLVFVMFRIWGVIRFIASNHYSCPVHKLSNEEEYCMSKACYYLLNNFTFVFQAFFDPLQGFGNAILFVFCAKTIRVRYKRLFYIMFYKLLSRFQRKDETGTSVETTPLLKRKSIDKINEKQAEAEVSSSDESFVEISYKSVINFKNSEY